MEKHVHLAKIDERPHPLDNPVWSALDGPHIRFGRRLGNVLRYRHDLTPYVAFSALPRDEDWHNLTLLVEPGIEVSVLGMVVQPPPGWVTVTAATGVQMVADRAGDTSTNHGSDVLRLCSSDVPEMISLAERTRPGPFLPRTIELGTYLGIRQNGRLVAMAGERLHPAGWSEISAVCTDEAWRGQGLAGRLVRALQAEICARGERPFLHVPVAKQGSIRLYKGLGFQSRRIVSFAILRIPD